MKVKIPPTTSRSSRGRLSHLGALVGRVGSGVGEDESGVSAQLQRALVPVVPQSSFHPAQVHGRVDDVVVVLEPHTWGQIRLLSHRAEPLRSTYRIVLEVHGLAERLRVFTPKYVVDQVLALVLPGVPVRHGLQRGLERASTRSTASRGRSVTWAPRPGSCSGFQSLPGSSCVQKTSPELPSLLPAGGTCVRSTGPDHK